jgi:hypothetical protein
MSKNPLFAGASRFAHLAGLSRTRAAADDGDDDTMKNGKRGKRADDASEQDDEDGTDKSGRRAEDTSDQDDENGTDKSGKRAADDKDGDGDDEDEDDDKGEMNGRSAASAARRRERARCAAIFAHPAAARNPALAADLAFETTMTRQEAIAVLRGQTRRSAATESRADRNPRVGPGGRADNAAGSIKASWLGAFHKAGATISERPLQRG